MHKANEGRKKRKKRNMNKNIKMTRERRGNTYLNMDISGSEVSYPDPSTDRAARSSSAESSSKSLRLLASKSHG